MRRRKKLNKKTVQKIRKVLLVTSKILKEIVR